jgi:hypothetical protein
VTGDKLKLYFLIGKIRGSYRAQTASSSPAEHSQMFPLQAIDLVGRQSRRSDRHVCRARFSPGGRAILCGPGYRHPQMFGGQQA